MLGATRGENGATTSLPHWGIVIVCVRSTSSVHKGKHSLRQCRCHFQSWHIWSFRQLDVTPALPDSFLGGSAPRLRTFRLTNIPFPAAPKLLLSASDLVDLKLDNISHSGYIPPASMVGCLSSLNKLTSLSLGFQSPRSRPDQPSPPPQSRVVLPALTNLAFDGMSEYSEDLVARIDTPVLNNLHMIFFSKPAFHIPHLKQFIDRAKGLKPSKAAEMRDLPIVSSTSTYISHVVQRWESGVGVGLQVPSLALLCGQVSHLFSLVEQLDLQSVHPPMNGVMPSTNSSKFSSYLPLPVVSMYLGSRAAHCICTAGTHWSKGHRSVTQPTRSFLGGICKYGSIQEVMQPFVDARRLSGHPVAVHYLDESGRAVR
jgi:hypothetical protein